MYLVYFVVGFNSVVDTIDDKIWLGVMKLALTPGFGPYTGIFLEWYSEVVNLAMAGLYMLVRESDFSLELVPTSVLDHIIEYAVDPFALRSMGVLPRLLCDERIFG